MKKCLIFVLLIFCVGIVNGQSLEWLDDSLKAFKLADSLDKPLVLYFRGSCEQCGKLEQNTFNNPVIKNLLSKYVCAKFEQGESNSLFKTFKVESVPTVIILSSPISEPVRLIGAVESQLLSRKLRRALKP
jgi:thioredoxin-related protein